MMLIRRNILAWTLVATVLVLAAPALRAADTPDDVLEDFQAAVDKIVADCCEDVDKRAAKAEEELAKHFEKGLCDTALRERNTMINLISNDYERCTKKLSTAYEKHYAALFDAVADLDPEVAIGFFDRLDEIRTGGRDALKAWKDAADKRVNDAYDTGAAEAGCEDDDGEN